MLKEFSPFERGLSSGLIPEKLQSQAQKTESTSMTAQEKREQREAVFALAKQTARKTNETFKELGGNGTLLGDDGAVLPGGYNAMFEGGVYTPKKIAGDKAKAEQVFIENHSLDKFSTQEYFRGRGARDTKEMIELCKQDLSKKKEYVAELALFVLLSKVLGKDYVVARTHELDDYDRDRGVDMIVINKATGEVLCAFDDVVDETSRDGVRIEEKKSKARKRAKSGGVVVEYGLKVEDGKMKRGAITEAPLFYLDIRDTELAELVTTWKNSPSTEEVTAKEKQIFMAMIASLDEQVYELKQLRVPHTLHAKLMRFDRILTELDTLGRSL